MKEKNQVGCFIIPKIYSLFSHECQKECFAEKEKAESKALRMLIGYFLIYVKAPILMYFWPSSLPSAKGRVPLKPLCSFSSSS